MTHVQVNVTSCPPPFLAASLFPATGGEVSARFCADPVPGLTCCLSCPLSYWVFDDNFDHQAASANWVGVVGFILNSLMLLTYILCPEEKSHRHYLSVGLTVSLLLLGLTFVVPLSTKPNQCYDEITPNNMRSDLSCAWSGALLLAGAMGAVTWILLRSIWTALRIVFDFKRTEVFKWISITLGGGVPALLLAVSIGVNGVSYRLYNVCIPNSQYGFVTWFVWLLVFASLASVILIFTILFCFWKFALSAIAAGLAGGNKFSGKSEEPTVSSVDGEKVPVKTKRARNRRKNVEWARIKRVLYLQWRTILLAFVVLNESIFYGLVFVQETAALEASTHGITQSDLAWGECLIVTGGNKNACLPLANGLGLSKAKLIATLYIATTIGPIVFLLMLRWSMLEGWWNLIRHPSQFKDQFMSLFRARRPSVGSQDFIMQASPKHISLNRPLQSEASERRPRGPALSPSRDDPNHAMSGTMDERLMTHPEEEAGLGVRPSEDEEGDEVESLVERKVKHEDAVLV